MPVRIAMTLFSLSLAACDATRGALLVRAVLPDAGEDAAAAAGSQAPLPPLRAAVRQDMALQYQITGELDTSVAAELFVSDLFDTSAQAVTALHAQGRVAIAYVSLGSLENWRDDATSFPRSAVGMSLAAYPNEAWLDVRRSEVRALMQARFELAADKGFDGLFASTLGVYRATSGFDLTQRDELDYLSALAARAHELGLSIGLSGDFELGAALAKHFDWAIAIGCVQLDFCAQLAPLSAAGLPVFDLEQDGDRSGVCQQAAAFGIPVTFKHRNYDAFVASCP